MQAADRRATYALAVLTFINLFNYIDRWVFVAGVIWSFAAWRGAPG